MTVYRNAQLMISGPEGTYGTAATLDRWLPYQGNPTVDWQPNDQESEAIYPGAIAMADGSYRPVEAAAGSIDFETKTKGFGRLYKAALGVGASNLVSGELYQQLFTLGDGPFFDSLTLQLARKLVDGTDDVHTYLGCVISSIEWKMDNSGVLTHTIEFDGRTMVTNIAKGSPAVSYPGRFTFAGFSVSTGAITPPTTTTPGSAPTAVDGVKSWSLKIDNQIVADDFRGNGTGLKSQPPVLQRVITGQMEADNTVQISAFRANWRANTGIPLIANFASGTDQLQFVMPYCRISSPPTPTAEGNLPTVTMPFEVRKDPAVAQGLWVVARTSDSAL